MKQPDNKKRSMRMKLLLGVLVIFIAHYFYSSYVLAHNNEVIVLCTIGAILCMGIKCMIFVSQSKKTDISIEMEDDI